MSGRSSGSLSKWRESNWLSPPEGTGMDEQATAPWRVCSLLIDLGWALSPHSSPAPLTGSRGAGGPEPPQCVGTLSGRMPLSDVKGCAW